jgi:predicted ribosome quality control (RQC) complex YloA/Tae2 family protein
VSALLVARDLEGRRIRRVDVPMDELVALTLDTKDVLVIAASVADRTLELGVVGERPRGRPADAVAQRLRKHLENATIARVVLAPDRGADLEIERGGTTHHLFAAPTERGVAIAVLTSAREVLVDTPLLRRELSISPGDEVAPLEGEETPLGREELERRGARAIAIATTDALDRRRAALEKAIRRARARLARRLDAIDEDGRRATEAPRLREEAALLLSAIAAWKRGASEAVVEDYRVDPPKRIVLAVDPREGPKKAADALFHTARRLERGAEMAKQRRALTEREIAALDALLAAALTARDRARLDEVAAEATSLGVRAVADGTTKPARPGSARAKATKEERKPYRRFLGFSDRPILVGRGAADNDALTTKHARPHDLWLHARAERGAHVIVPLARGEACPPELLGDAAMLAAHFSDARGEPLVEVQYAERRHVRKPRGAPLGTVLVDREKVILVRLSRERLAWLLARERF